MLVKGKSYEVDELCTYIGKKSRKRWVAYALLKDTKQVVGFVVGTRAKRTIEKLTILLLLSEPKKIFTDKLNIY